MFSFIRSLHIVFQSSYTSLHPYQECVRVPFSPRPPERLVLVVFLVVVILTGVRWNLSVVLICISFMVRDGEHFFMCFLAIWLLPLKNFCLVQLPTSFMVHWFWRSLVFWAMYQFLVWYIASKDFLPLCGWSLQLKDHLFHCAEAF
jgi:hypothetical protein